jgi:hypothetical protein
MKQKLKDLKNKFPGSILVYSLIILSIMLMTALSIASVTVMERKSAGTTGASNQAFAVADSGSELFLGRIKNKSGTLNSVFGASCPAGGNTYTGNVSTVGNFTVTFFKADGTQATCNDQISSITKIKSAGYSNNATRAIEVAVAASSVNNGNHCDNLQLGSVQADAGLADAVKNCRDLSTGGGDWYLPTAEELACFIKDSTATADALWTRTGFGGASDPNRYATLVLSTGVAAFSDLGVGVPTTKKYRCVR